MAESVKIDTGKYVREGNVDIDGNIWRVVLPGAGTELRFSQASRACRLNAARLDLLDKKIEEGKITESDLDNYENYSNRYEENERILYEIFQNTFRDGTDDNLSVKRWVNDTPTSIIMMTFEDIKKRANEKKAENGRK